MPTGAAVSVSPPAASLTFTAPAADAAARALSSKASASSGAIPDGLASLLVSGAIVQGSGSGCEQARALHSSEAIASNVFNAPGCRIGGRHSKKGAPPARRRRLPPPPSTHGCRRPHAFDQTQGFPMRLHVRSLGHTAAEELVLPPKASVGEALDMAMSSLSLDGPCDRHRLVRGALAVRGGHRLRRRRREATARSLPARIATPPAACALLRRYTAAACCATVPPCSATCAAMARRWCCWRGGSRRRGRLAVPPSPRCAIDCWLLSTNPEAHAIARHMECTWTLCAPLLPSQLPHVRPASDLTCQWLPAFHAPTGPHTVRNQRSDPRGASAPGLWRPGSS